MLKAFWNNVLARCLSWVLANIGKIAIFAAGLGIGAAWF